MNIIDEFLNAHPAPWHVEVDGNGMCRIMDSDDSTVESMLTSGFSRFVVGLVNQRHVNREASEAIASEIEAKLEEARRERDSMRDNLNAMIDGYNAAIAQRDASEIAMLGAQQDVTDLHAEMAELHEIIEAQRALIDGLQRRLSRKEARS